MTEPMVPDSVQLWIAIRYQLRSYLRTLRFLALAGLTIALLGLVFVVLLPNVPPSYNPSDGTSFMAGFSTILSLTIFLDAALLGGDAISTDFGARTGYYTLVLPIRRMTLFLGRFLAAVMAACVLVGLFYALTAFEALYFFQSVPVWAVLQSFGIACFLAAAAMGLAFFFSSLLKTPALSIVLTVLILYILLPVAVSLVSAFSTSVPWWSLTSAEATIPYPFGVTGVFFGGGGSGWDPTWQQGLGIMAVYLGVFALLGYVIYEFKESTG